MWQKYTSVHLSHRVEKQGGGVGMKRRRWRTRASCAAREHVSWAGVLTDWNMTAQIPQPISRNLFPSLRTPFDGEEGVKQTRGFNCFHWRLARRRTMRRWDGAQNELASKMLRKVRRQRNGGRKRERRERISFYAFKAVLSTKTTQNGPVKYCAEGGRKNKT